MNLKTLAGNITVTLFIVIQLTDGLATYYGVALFGTSVEANPLLRVLMERYDIVLVLTSAKVLATIAGSILHFLQRHLMVAALTILYMILTVLPWMRVLALHS